MVYFTVQVDVRFSVCFNVSIILQYILMLMDIHFGQNKTKNIGIKITFSIPLVEGSICIYLY